MKTSWLLVLCAGLAVPVGARPLTGHVVGADDKPVAGARVSLFTARGRSDKPLQQTQSDANGAFTLDGPDEEGDYRTVQIEAPGAGFLTGVVLNNSAAANWKIAPAASLSGTVVDENDAPVPNALISVAYLAQDRRYLGEVHSIETRSDAQGRWTLNGLPQDYEVNCLVRAPGKALARFGALVEEHGAPFPAVKLRGGFDVKGTVRDEQGAPVAGVQIYSTGDGQNGAMSDDKGEFSIANLALQAQDVRVQTERPELFPPGNVRVSPEQPVASILLKRGVPLRGRFVDSATKKPVTDVSFSVDAMSSEKFGLKPDAQGRFQVFAPAGVDQLAIRISAPAFLHHDEFLDATKIALGDLGDIALTRGTIWKGRVTLGGKAPGQNVYLNFRSGQSSGQIQAEPDGTFQTPALAPGNYVWDASAWDFKPLAPAKITVPAVSDAPFVQDIAVQKIPDQIVRGRVQTPDGAPVPYAQVVLSGGRRATTRADGTWQTSAPASEAEPHITRVTLGEQKLMEPPAKARRDGDGWTFSPLEWNQQPREVRLVVRDAAGRGVRGARVMAVWDGDFKTTSTDETGTARWKLPPAKIRFFAAKDLDFGEATSPDAGVSLLLASPNLDKARAQAEAILAGQTDVSALLGQWDVLGKARLRAAALRADGAQGASRNYGRFLSSLLYKEPKAAFAEIPFVETIATPERQRPFELRQAEESLALRAARSDDAEAKAWAQRWLDGARRDFAFPVELKPDWSGGDQSSRFLAIYAVATSLDDPLARSFFDAAIDALPASETNPQVFSYAGYFSIDDPNLSEFRAALPVASQLDFAAACAFSANIETPAQAKRGLTLVEEVAASPAIRAKVPADSVARSLDWARFQTLGVLLKDPQLPLRPVLEQLRALGSTYQAGNLALAAAQFAFDRGDQELSREFLQLGQKRGWLDENSAFSPDDPKSQARKKFLLSQFPGVPATAIVQPSLEVLRAQALTDLRLGQKPIGNMMSNGSEDARRLRALDPAFGRLILEAKWALIGPLDENNRFEARGAASAMELYDPSRAFDWLAALNAQREAVQTAAHVLAPENVRAGD